MFLYVERYTIKHWYTRFFPRVNKSTSFQKPLAQTYWTPKIKLFDNLPAKDGSSNNGISKYIDIALYN